MNLLLPVISLLIGIALYIPLKERTVATIMHYMMINITIAYSDLDLEGSSSGTVCATCIYMKGTSTYDFQLLDYKSGENVSQSFNTLKEGPKTYAEIWTSKHPVTVKNMT